jgi:hypothetical protein
LKQEALETAFTRTRFWSAVGPIIKNSGHAKQQGFAAMVRHQLHADGHTNGQTGSEARGKGKGRQARCVDPSRIDGVAAWADTLPVNDSGKGL